MTVADPPTYHARVDPRLEAHLAELVEQANPSLGRVLGDAAGRVTADWEPTQADGEPAARIRLTDGGVSRDAAFTEFDLSDERETRWRLYRLWAEVIDEHLRLIRGRLAREGD